MAIDPLQHSRKRPQSSVVEPRWLLFGRLLREDASRGTDVQRMHLPGTTSHHPRHHPPPQPKPLLELCIQANTGRSVSLISRGFKFSISTGARKTHTEICRVGTDGRTDYLGPDGWKGGPTEGWQDAHRVTGYQRLYLSPARLQTGADKQGFQNRRQVFFSCSAGVERSAEYERASFRSDLWMLVAWSVGRWFFIGRNFGKYRRERLVGLEFADRPVLWGWQTIG